MRQISLEQILLLLLFIIVPLADYLVQRMRTRSRRTTPAPGPTPAQPIPPRVRRSIQPATIASPPRRDTIAAQSPVVATANKRQRSASILGGTREVRRAIIAITILGPCHANEHRAESSSPSAAAQETRKLK